MKLHRFTLLAGSLLLLLFTTCATPCPECLPEKECGGLEEFYSDLEETHEMTDSLNGIPDDFLMGAPSRDELMENNAAQKMNAAGPPCRGVDLYIKAGCTTKAQRDEIKKKMEKLVKNRPWLKLTVSDKEPGAFKFSVTESGKKTTDCPPGTQCVFKRGQPNHWIVNREKLYHVGNCKITQKVVIWQGSCE